MAETVKKAPVKAAAKAAGKMGAKAPAKAITKIVLAKTHSEQVKAVAVTHEAIAQLARKYWEQRGWQDGYAEQDWLRAEGELNVS